MNIKRHKIYRFYSTYEELKLASYKCNTAKQSSFYSTYEELKRGMSTSLIFISLSFYSTYEELKPKSGITISSA